MKYLTLFCLLLALALPLQAGQEGKTDARLSRAAAALPPGGRVLAWVFFTDKGTHERLAPAVPRTVVSERSLRRRAKVRPADALVDYTDLPVEQSYVQQVAGFAAEVRQQSRWLNGVSILATPGQLRAIEALPCVRSLEPVTRYRRNATESVSADLAPPLPRPDGTTSFNYGLSLNQVTQINVPAVHDRNNYGQGVVVGVFDNGFRLLNHEVFDTLRPRIIATYDFVDHKSGVAPNNPDPSFGAHGVNTLSTIGGFKSGQLIGPAFGATFILARTENDSSETPFEEDNWVAAIEWADSIGVDVTSTSLGYLTYDTPYTSWTWQDMNGNTTAITRAADMAAGRGILIVNSAGNEGDNVSHNTLGAPADGDSVFTIGGVTPAGVRNSFSSVGPTTSIPPRIKPDVMAQGSSVRVASATVTTGYAYSQGTSFSCPLAAGVAALMVHARPTDSPMEIMNVLRSTASRASTPDNRYGYGILNVLAALAPAASANLAPANAASDRDTVVPLSWTRSRWATAYRLQVSTSSLFTTMILNDSTVTDTVRLTGGLAPGSTYYWRVAALNVYGTSAFSPAWSFTTSSAPPAAATLLAPVDGTANVPTGTTLSWSPTATATRYHLQVAGDSSFSILYADDSTVTATAIGVTGLPYVSTIFWKVRAGNGAGWGTESAVWRFTTVPAPPLPPDLVWPADSAGALPLSVTLLWRRSEGAVTYEARVSTHADFSSTVIDDSTLADTSLTVGPLLPGVEYFWQVRGRIPSGAGVWPASRRFSTSPGTVRTCPIASGWNLVSLPVSVADPTPGAVFPAAVSQPFHFTASAGYAVAETLVVGSGYWLKFDAPESLAVAGDAVWSDSIAVAAGWNLVGTLSGPVDTAAVLSTPPGIRVSDFYRFGTPGGYQVDAVLQPGRGYWVKAGGAGMLILQHTPGTTATRTVRKAAERH